MPNKNKEYIIHKHITKLPYKHIQLKGIKKNPQINKKMLRSSRLSIIWSLFCGHSFRNKTHEKKNSKQNTSGNKRKHSFFFPVRSIKPS